MNDEAAAEVPTRSGFVGVAGRPNVGKSTLVNSLVGSEIAISSVRPQTTRRAIRGVYTDSGAGFQIVLVDLPGVQRPLDRLTSRMQKRVERELADSDLVLLVVNADEGIGPGDRFIASALIGARATIPVICAVNKADLAGRGIVPVLDEAARLEGVDEVFPVSAKTGEGVAELRRALMGELPAGPFLYPADATSDQSPELLVAELIRGEVLRLTREEVPHAVEVEVLAIEPREAAPDLILAEIWVETPSQRGILVGRAGRRITEIGTAARKRIERSLGREVYLDLQVKVRSHWRRDDSMLDRLGIE
jgi:GTP-binding protein Era